MPKILSGRAEQAIPSLDLPFDPTPNADKLARDILNLSRNTLLVNLRFLDVAISQLKLLNLDPIRDIAIDGQYLFYNTRHILNSYKQQRETPVRDYLHVIFHCLFHHPFINKTVRQPCWDLACDIASENAINGLGLAVVSNARQARQLPIIEGLKGGLTVAKKDTPLLTAEKLYRFYLDQDLSDEQIQVQRQDFYADSHNIWYAPEKKQASRQEQQGGSGERGKGVPEKGAKASDQDRGAEKGEEDDADGMSEQELKDLWKQIAERAQVDIETASRKWGDLAGGLHQELNQVNREKYDYDSFLKRFSVLGEAMQVNDDEFDLIFYTYGLKLYKNLPLIEPLEYKEVKRVKEFVIAIDTSGSVQGKTVQSFVQKTYNILKQTESFFTKINVHFIQCDAQIQEDHKITSAEEFEYYLKTMELRGFGGTDFRPVFSYVDQLIENREFENLKGLIYFTDGMGVYPERKPKYDTAFVFLDEDYVDTPNVPGWAIKLVLSTDDVMD